MNLMCDTRNGRTIDMDQTMMAVCVGAGQASSHDS